MRWQIVSQVARRSQAAIGAGLTQFSDRFDQLVNLLLLSYDDFVELVNQVLCVAGFYLQLDHSVVQAML